MSLPGSTWKMSAHRKREMSMERFWKSTPNDLAAVKGGKDAAAAASMQRGGWEREETTYRDLIKDKDQAIALEQQARVYRGDDMIDFLLGELSEKYVQDPENLDTARRIAELYEEKNDLENAVTWFGYAAQLSQIHRLCFGSQGLRPSNQTIG